MRVKRRYDKDAAARLGAAVHDVERRSCAELVLEVHARAGSYAHADARFAALLAFLSVVTLLFVPVVFPPVALLIDALVFYFLGLWIARKSDSVRRLMTTARERNDLVRLKASSLYHERGIGNTEGETGLLLFVSLLERRVEILADRGLLRAMRPDDWNALLAELHTMQSVTPDDLLAVIGKLGALLEHDAPAGECNPDELASAPGLYLQ